MMEWSDAHCRYFWRLLSKNARLYTEMVTTGALIHGERSRFLHFNPQEQPIALQLGGSNVKDLTDCAKIAEDAGFNEVNLNCGCPSDRVQNNKIGACLMAEPKRVAECLNSMQNAVKIPITVKHRIGIDELDSEAYLHSFVAELASAGCDVFIVHARKAWLKGLSPKENREIPPLHYDYVHNLKKAFNTKTFVINGGLNTLAQCQEQLNHVDGVMMGREAYHNPFVLAEVDKLLFEKNSNLTANPALNSTPYPNTSITREQALQAFIEYSWQQFKAGTRLHHMSRHILGIYAGQHGGKLFRRYLSENACKKDATPEVLQSALDQMITHNLKQIDRQTP